MDVTSDDTVLVELKGVRKTFGGAVALAGLDLAIRSREILGLVGENGSGKSTAIKILTGYYTPERGEVRVQGRTVALPLTAASARPLHIACVHQSLGLLGDMTVTENFFATRIAQAPVLRAVHRQARRSELAHLAKERLAAVGANIGDVGVLVRTLSPLQQALLAIARAVSEIDLSGPGGGLLILDEPTVYLTVSEREGLYAALRRLRDEGCAVLLVSHDIDEVLAVADKVAVLRDGVAVGVEDSATVSRGTVVEMMTGGAVDGASADAVRTSAASVPAASESGRAELSVRGLSNTTCRDVNFTVETGEIVGFAGLAGSGSDSILRTLYGAGKDVEGELVIGGHGHVLKRLRPRTARDLGIVLIPRSRLTEGVVADLSVGENVVLPTLNSAGRHRAVSPSAAAGRTGPLLSRFKVKPPTPTVPMSSLSGGNQQKVVFAKWLQTSPRLILLEEPTQGVDVGARAVLWDIVRSAARDGACVLVSSSDYEELAALCDRVYIMRHGVVKDVLPREALSKASIHHASYEPAT